MTDPTSATPTPAIVPAYLVLLDKLANDMATLCDNASLAGLTANMILGQLEAIKFCILQDSLTASEAAPPINIPTPPAPAPAASDVVFFDLTGAAGAASALTIHGTMGMDSTGTSWLFPGGDSSIAVDDQPTLTYPITIGAFWNSPKGVDNPYCLISLNSDTNRRMALYAQNDGSVMAQAMDASSPDQLAVYGQAVLPGAENTSQFVLSAAVFVSATERYVYSTGVGMSAPDTTPVDGTGSQFTIIIGDDGGLSHPFIGMLRDPFVISGALTAADFALIEANPKTLLRGS